MLEAASTAASNSSYEEMVSIQITSAPASASASALLGEHLDSTGVGQGAQRLEKLAGGPDAPRDRHWSIGGFNCSSCDLDCRPIQLRDPVLEMVQREAEPVPAKGVGEDDVGSRRR